TKFPTHYAFVRRKQKPVNGKQPRRSASSGISQSVLSTQSGGALAGTLQVLQQLSIRCEDQDRLGVHGTFVSFHAFCKRVERRVSIVRLGVDTRCLRVRFTAGFLSRAVCLRLDSLQVSLALSTDACRLSGAFGPVAF